MPPSSFFTSCMGMDKILVCVEGRIVYSWRFLSRHHIPSFLRSPLFFQTSNSNILPWKWWICTWSVSPGRMVLHSGISWHFVISQDRERYLDAQPLSCHWFILYLWVCWLLSDLGPFMSTRTPLQDIRGELQPCQCPRVEITLWDIQPTTFASFVQCSNEITEPATGSRISI